MSSVGGLEGSVFVSSVAGVFALSGAAYACGEERTDRRRTIARDDMRFTMERLRLVVEQYNSSSTPEKVKSL